MRSKKILIEIPQYMLQTIDNQIKRPADINSKILKCIQLGYSQLTTKPSPTFQREAVNPKG